MSIAVDFTSGTTLFPGLRLCDDMGGYYQNSLAVIRDVLGKMPVLGATDALMTLHGTSEMPPANFIAGGCVVRVERTLSSTTEVHEGALDRSYTLPTCLLHCL